MLFCARKRKSPRMIISISDIWVDAAIPHRRYLSHIIDTAILNLQDLHGPVLSLENKIIQFLEQNRQELLDFLPAGLGNVISQYEIFFPTEMEMNEANIVFEYIFDYSDFSLKHNSHINIWSAYKLCRSAKYSFCSYCHISPTDTKMPTGNSAASFRPNIDHFYSKARYPFLSLTLGNFIPCCERCNGRQMKGDKNFHSIPHLNPLIDPQSIRFDFTLLPEIAAHPLGTMQTLDREENYEIKLISYGALINKAAQTLETFQLPDRYKLFTGEAFRLRRQIITHRARRRMIGNALPFLNSEESDIVGFDVTNDDYKNSILGKLKFDIYNDVISNF